MERRRCAAYVAIDQVTGTLVGKAGGFMLVHRGTIDKSGASDLSVIIAPGSGSGALEGISGSLTIGRKDGQHFFDLAYVLPDTFGEATAISGCVRCWSSLATIGHQSGTAVK